VRRAAEYVQRIPGHGYRGNGGVGGLGDLWQLRVTYAAMGEDWLPSVRAWCAWWRDHRGRIRSLGGWLARERYEAVDVPELVDLPEPPPPIDAAEEDAEEAEPPTPWQAAIRELEELGLPMSVAHALEANPPTDGRLPELDPLRAAAFDRFSRANQNAVSCAFARAGVG
jgi:hypothetical protein